MLTWNVLTQPVFTRGDKLSETVYFLSSASAALSACCTHWAVVTAMEGTKQDHLWSVSWLYTSS